MEYQGGKKNTKFLTEMKELIPFEAIEKLLARSQVSLGNVYKVKTQFSLVKNFIKGDSFATLFFI
jgi:hypothetical protein